MNLHPLPNLYTLEGGPSCLSICTLTSRIVSLELSTNTTTGSGAAAETVMHRPPNCNRYPSRGDSWPRITCDKPFVLMKLQKLFRLYSDAGLTASDREFACDTEEIVFSLSDRSESPGTFVRSCKLKENCNDKTKPTLR